MVDFDGGGKVSFKYVTTPRYERQWSYFGTYLIGQTVSLDLSVARTSHPFLLRQTIEEELDDNIQILDVEESVYRVYDGFMSKEPTNAPLASMVEQKIA
jgi:hypothetical protein